MRGVKTSNWSKQCQTNQILLSTYCSALLRLTLNTKMGFKHHHPTPPTDPPGTFSKASRLSRVTRFAMGVSRAEKLTFPITQPT